MSELNTLICGHKHWTNGYRGCCKKCYDRYLKSIRRGETTWEQLEREGKVGPQLPRGNSWRWWYTQKGKVRK